MRDRVIPILAVLAAVSIVCATVLTAAALDGLSLVGTRTDSESGKWSTPTQIVTFVDDEGVVVLDDSYGVYGTSAVLEDVYPGWSGLVPLTIINGLDSDKTFRVSATPPSHAGDGYQAFPAELLYWVSVPVGDIALEAGGTCELVIALAVPEEASLPEKTELRILVEETTQTGLVRTAGEMKWFIIATGG